MLCFILSSYEKIQLNKYHTSMKDAERTSSISSFILILFMSTYIRIYIHQPHRAFSLEKEARNEIGERYKEDFNRS